MRENNRDKKLPLKLRVHPIVLGFRLAGWTFFGLALITVVIPALIVAPQLVGLAAGLTTASIILIIVGNIYLFLWWLNNYYLFDEKKVVHFRGVFWQRRRNLRYPTLDQLRIKQGLIGQVFNYGTLELESTETEKKMSLKNISNPQHFLHLAQKYMPSAERF